jgi:hypothetical protein
MCLDQNHQPATREVTLETERQPSRRVRVTNFLNHNSHQNLKKLENIAGHGNHLSRPEDYCDSYSPVKRKNRQNKIQEILSNLQGIQSRYQPKHKPGSWSARYDSEGNSRKVSVTGFPEEVKVIRKKAQRFLDDENINKSIESLLYNDQIIIGNTRGTPSLGQLDVEPRVPSCKKKIFLENNNLSVPDASPQNDKDNRKASVLGRLTNYSGIPVA